MESKQNYKRLGDYIQEVNIRNRDLAVGELLGVSIQKCFMPSIANTIGTDMSTYKVVQRGQFAYGSVTSRNGDKVSIALLSDCEQAIVSQAYTIFEVKDMNELLPEYLMMWFRRSEFDRYARYRSHGSAREVFDWSEMCDLMLPIPTIEQQKTIVAQYETLTQRIKLNQQLCSKLEQTAQALYRKMFVDDIDMENLPDGWRVGTLGDVVESYSKTHNFKKKRLVFLNTSDILKGEVLTHEYSTVSDMPGQAKKSIKKDDILFSEIRPANKRYALVRFEADDYVVSTKLMVLRICDNKTNLLKIYYFLTLEETLSDLQKEADGASGTFPQITFDGNLKMKKILFGDMKTEEKWLKFLTNYYNTTWLILKENIILNKMQYLLLSKLSNN